MYVANDFESGRQLVVTAYIIGNAWCTLPVAWWCHSKHALRVRVVELVDLNSVRCVQGRCSQAILLECGGQQRELGWRLVLGHVGVLSRVLAFSLS